VSFVLVKRPDETLSASELALVDAIVARSIAIFEAQTGGRGSIVNRTASDDPFVDDDSAGESGSSGGDGSAVGSAGGGGSPGSGTGDDLPGVPPFPKNDEDGCGCSRAPPHAGAWWLAIAFGLLRRRQRWSCGYRTVI
jgi:MYXO-CTERM domain-containing protein